MKRIDECTDMTVLVALLVLGILLVMGAYRIFSFLCEHAALDARTFLLGAAVGTLFTGANFTVDRMNLGNISGGNTCGTTANNV